MNNLPPNFLDEVEKFSGKSLNKKEDIILVLEVCNSNEKFKEFKDLAFTGKYVNGLFRVLQNSVKIPKVENIDQIKKDLSENMEKVISQLNEIAFYLNEKHKTFFEDNYTKLSKSSLQNLQHLVEDLDNIKKYLNFLKRK